MEEWALKIEDVETLVEEVSDVTYDKAVEVVADTVLQETQKEDLRLVEKTKKNGYSRRSEKRRKKSVSMLPPGRMG